MEENLFSPKTWDDFVGQTELKRRVKVYMDAALATNEPLPHVLLATYPGQGKTALTDLIIRYLNERSFQMDLSSMTPIQFTSAMRRFPGGIIFFDEAHRASKKQLEQLLTLMEEKYVASPTGSKIEIPWLTAILATTEPEKIPRALRDRCPIQPEFIPYTDEELTQIVQQMANGAGLHIPSDIAEGMGHAAAYTPRLARNMVKAYRALSYQCVPSLDDVLDLCEIDSDGLGSRHIAYLKALDKLDGLAGAKPLMTVLQLSVSALEDIERVLFMRNMISFTSSGRYILPAGDNKIRENREEEKYYVPRQ